MSLSIDCAACGAHFKVPDAIYERRIRGRVATLLCKKCKQPIEVDGRADGPPPDEAALSAAEPEEPAKPEVEPKKPEPEVKPVPPKPEVKPVPPKPEVEPPKRPEPEVEPPKPDKPEIEPPPDKPEITPERPTPEQPSPGEPAKPRASAYRPRQASEPRRRELELPASPKPPVAAAVDRAAPPVERAPAARPAPAAARGVKPAARPAAPIARTPAVLPKPRAAVRATPPAQRPPPKPRARLEPRSVPPPPSPPSERPPPRAERAVESVAPISVDVEVDLASVPPPAPPSETVAEVAAPIATPKAAKPEPSAKPKPAPRVDEMPATAVAVADDSEAFGKRRTGTRTFVVSFVIGAVIAAIALFVWRQNRAPAPSEPDRLASPPQPTTKSELETEPTTRAASHGSEPSEPSGSEPSGGSASADVKQALVQTAESASRCRQAESQAGNAYVSLIVAPTGDIVSARVTNAPYEGTPTASCIEAVFRKLKLAPFSGAAQTLHQTVRVR